VLIRTGLRLVLQSHDDLDVVGEAGDGREALELAGRLHPDSVLTTFDLDEYVFGALRAGAAGFLLKDASRERLVEAIRVVHAGDALLSPSITRRLIEDFARRTDPIEPPEKVLAVLTPREREALGLLARGLSNVEIAQRLFVTEATVKSHVSSVLAKLELRDRVQAVVFAYEHGLVIAGSSG
jgi:DNA-binding NarL/FixJ family response regulator